MAESGGGGRSGAGARLRTGRGTAGCGALGRVRAAEQGHAGDMKPHYHVAGGRGQCTTMVRVALYKGPQYARVPAR